MRGGILVRGRLDAPRLYVIALCVVAVLVFSGVAFSNIRNSQTSDVDGALVNTRITGGVASGDIYHPGDLWIADFQIDVGPHSAVHLRGIDLHSFGNVEFGNVWIANNTASSRAKLVSGIYFGSKSLPLDWRSRSHIASVDELLSANTDYGVIIHVNSTRGSAVSGFASAKVVLESGGHTSVHKLSMTFVECGTVQTMSITSCSSATQSLIQDGTPGQWVDVLGLRTFENGDGVTSIRVT
jgi:hypothetical protein